MIPYEYDIYHQLWSSVFKFSSTRSCGSAEPQLQVNENFARLFFLGFQPTLRIHWALKGQKKIGESFLVRLSWHWEVGEGIFVTILSWLSRAWQALSRSVLGSHVSVRRWRVVTGRWHETALRHHSVTTPLWRQRSPLTYFTLSFLRKYAVRI